MATFDLPYRFQSLTRLQAPRPGWAIRTKVLIIGSGVAGLFLALDLHSRGIGPITIVTKANIADGSTRWAQGGVAAVLGSGDTPEQHIQDTLTAGDGLCREDAVSVLAHEGAEAVRRLILLGAKFDRDSDGKYQLTREGGHHRLRIVHAHGDATGAEIMRTLENAIREAGIKVYDHAMVIDLDKDQNDRVCGVTMHVMGEGQQDGVGRIHADAVVLATGGLGHVFAQTTNPSVSTGDGVAMAFRAGAAITDMEFIQFHPTAFAGANTEGQLPLVSEAVRGEGAHLRNTAGERFMVDRHPMAELAPRDVVAKAILTEMIRERQPFVYLDATMFGEQKWQERFPGILEMCRSHGLDPVTQMIPVAPAAHYASGGVKTDVYGRTTLPGLYAVGEVACTGVHGANRLASNSLLEGLVFAHRIAEIIDAEATEAGDAKEWIGDTMLLDPMAVTSLPQLMTQHVGVLRSATSLEKMGSTLYSTLARRGTVPSLESWNATNRATVSSLITMFAYAREETRGGHWRDDFPSHDESLTGVHNAVCMTRSGIRTWKEA